MARKRRPDEPPLIEAVMSGRLKRVQELLAAGADPNESSTKDEAALTLASRHAEIALALIDAGADVSRADRSIINPVWAVTLGRADVVAKVLDAGGELNCKTMMGTPLHVAAREGKAGILGLLIERGADVNAGNLAGTPVYAALRNNHTECVRLLIEGGVDLQPPPYAADTLLTRATHNRCTPMVELLLAAGLPVDARGKISETDPETFKLQELYANATPLLIAARLGELPIVEALLQAGADPTLRDEDGKRPLDLARELGHADVAARLEEALAAFDAGASTSVEEDLLLAVERGEVERVRELIATGVDVNLRDTRSKSAAATPLLLAARHGHVEVARALLEAGADPSLADTGDEKSVQMARWLYREVDVDTIREQGVPLGRTALHEVAELGSEVGVELLLAAGAPVDAPDVIGMTPLLLAARGGHASLVRRLLAAGANPKAVDADKTGSLATAVAGGSVECVELLLAAGAKLPGGKKQNLLARAARSGNAPVVAALARAGASVDAVDAFGDTALIDAAEAGHVDVVRQLIELGAGVNHRNVHGETALIRGATLGVSTTEYAAVRERDDPLLYRKVEMARVLLDAGADINAVSTMEQGALAMAAYSQNEPLVRFLLDRGADPAVGDVAGTPLALARRHSFAPDLIDRLSRGAAPQSEQRSSPVKAASEPQTASPDDPTREPEVSETPALPLPDFSAALAHDAYRQALTDLEAWCGTKAVPFEHAPGAFHLHVDSRSGFEFETARQDFLARGCTLVWTDPLEQQQVGVFPTIDQFEVVHAMGVHAPNYDLGPQQVIAWLRDLHAEQPFEITGLRYDTIDGRFLEDVREPRKLAKRMYAFCPDIVDQGTGTVAALALSMQKDRRLYFWWD